MIPIPTTPTSPAIDIVKIDPTPPSPIHHAIKNLVVNPIAKIKPQLQRTEKIVNFITVEFNKLTNSRTGDILLDRRSSPQEILDFLVNDILARPPAQHGAENRHHHQSDRIDDIAQPIIWGWKKLNSRKL